MAPDNQMPTILTKRDQFQSHNMKHDPPFSEQRQHSSQSTYLQSLLATGANSNSKDIHQLIRHKVHGNVCHRDKFLNDTELSIVDDQLVPKTDDGTCSILEDIAEPPPSFREEHYASSIPPDIARQDSAFKARSNANEQDESAV